MRPKWAVFMQARLGKKVFFFGQAETSVYICVTDESEVNETPNSDLSEEQRCHSHHLIMCEVSA